MIYTFTGSISGVTAAKTLFHIIAPSTGIVKVLESHVTNGDNDTNEQFECAWQKASTPATPTATTALVLKHNDSAPAPSGTYEYDITSGDHTYGTGQVGYRGRPLLEGHHWEPTPLGIFTLQPSAAAGLLLLQTIASTKLLIEVLVDEVSG